MNELSHFAEVQSSPGAPARRGEGNLFIRHFSLPFFGDDMSRVLLPVCIACLLLLSPLVLAESPDAGIAGAWTWSQTRPDGKVIKIVLTLKQDGPKLTGTFHGEGPDSDIHDGTIKGREVSFIVDRTVSNHKVAMTYSGNLDNDTITGHVKMRAAFRERTAEWSAKRVTQQRD
jgi:hypothetical protein